VTGSDPGFAVPALAISESYPSILYVRIGASAQFIGDVRHADLVIANSNAVATSIKGFGRDAAFLPSVFPPEVYRVPTSRDKVLFVNPIPKKGVHIAMSLAAARPDIPFVFNLSWRMRSSELRRLRRAVRRLGNVEVRSATTRPEQLYRDCRLVLVPSQWPEAWCRIVSEAQINAIPALASNVAGLPESVGPGGILVDPKDSRRAWLKALSEAWDDGIRYKELSRRALVHSQRPELSVPLVVDRFELLLKRAIEEHARCTKIQPV
jgi:glycosyltransferase involved in cell wall biosynthesis